MHAGCVLIAMAAVGVETGWQPLDRGGLEYIIQIEPALLDALRSGEAITSEIPSAVEGVRRYRIVVGSDPVPRIGADRVSPSSQPAPADTSTLERSAVAEPGRYPGLESAPLVQAEHSSGPPLHPALPPPPVDGGPSSDGRSLEPSPQRHAHTGPQLPPPPDSESEERAGGGVPSSRSPSPINFGSRPKTGAPETAESSPSGVAFPKDPSSATPPIAAGSPPASDFPPARHSRASTPATDPPALPASQPAHPSSESAEAPRAAPGKHASANAAATETEETAFPAPPQATSLPADAPKPWMPLVFTLIALFASLGGNVYLGWIAWDSRQQYRRIARQTRRPA